MTVGTQATDEVWAVEGPEVAGMPIEESEHQVDVVNHETEEMEGTGGTWASYPG